MKSDHPLNTISEDTLQRARFARDIAKRLLELTSHQSLVVGIQGPWGSGKSTVLNFLAEYVDDDKFTSLELAEDTSRPLIVRFNPWWFSGQEDLFSRFFNEIASQISNKGALEKAGSIFQAIGNTAKLALPLWAIGSSEGTQIAAISAGADIVKHLGESWLKKKSLDALRKDLTESLNTAQTPIWVLIDDVERLQPHEVRQMFALVRSVGDLPYVKYILAYDPQTLEANLDAFSGGELYVEKIVQVPFTLPEPDLLRMSELFYNAIDEVIQNLQVTEPVIDLRIKTMQCFLLLRPVLGSVRSINRLSNSLRLSLPAVINDVEMVDFILLEAIKVFVPRVHRSLPTMKHELIPTKKQRQSRHDADPSKGLMSSSEKTLLLLTEGLQKVHKFWVSNVVKTVFPAVEINSPWDYDDSGEHRRASNLESFDIYFGLTTPTLAFPKEIQKLIPKLLLTTPKEFTHLMAALYQESSTKHMTTALALAENWLLTADCDNAFQVAISLSKHVDMWTDRGEFRLWSTVEAQLITTSAKKFFRTFFTTFTSGEKTLKQASWLVFEAAHELLMEDATNLPAQRFVEQSLSPFIEKLSHYIPNETIYSSRQTGFPLPHDRSFFYLLINWYSRDVRAFRILKNHLPPRQLYDVLLSFKKELSFDERKQLISLLDSAATEMPELLEVSTNPATPNYLNKAKEILGIEVQPNVK